MSGRILVVEDDERIRSSMRLALSQRPASTSSSRTSLRSRGTLANCPGSHGSATHKASAGSVYPTLQQLEEFKKQFAVTPD